MLKILSRILKNKTVQVVQFSFFSKVPDHPAWEYTDYEKLPKVPEIDLQLIEQLERISLVEFNNEEGVRRLQAAVQSARLLHQIDTQGIEPLDSVLENRELWLREDTLTEGNCLDDILNNASEVEEDYFVAPPGNIPLKKRYKQHLSNVVKDESKVAGS
uniref:Glutamyl-tRNA(Gln) amidotransferase subunit C, mitochondrial n=1 Tax=Arion vulgaris TaxID=1028688 RepID=A0A0B7A1P6_9EUPU